ncbi:MAG: hypothetical protein R3B72_01275 [Polyangiaceae bacterium]
MLFPLGDGHSLDLGGLVPGGRDPRWQQAYDALRAHIARGDGELLAELWPQLAREPALETLAGMAFRGQIYAGLSGARAFLAELAEPPSFESNPFTSGPERWAGLLAHGCTPEALAWLASDPEPPPGIAREVLVMAVQDHVLFSGEVDRAAFPAWCRGDLPWAAHPWERDLVRPLPIPHDTDGNFYMRASEEPPWPEGRPKPPGLAGVPLTVRCRWGLDDRFDRDWPDEIPPPVGPFADPTLFPNGLTWCLEVDDDHGDLATLGRWPFPEAALDLSEVVAEPSSPRALLRAWLWRGVVGGAYTRRRGAAVGRRSAWEGLARLLGLVEDASRPCLVELPDLTRIADAAEALTVWGFRSRGPQVEQLGGDFGFVARRPDGRAFAAAHSDGD